MRALKLLLLAPAGLALAGCLSYGDSYGSYGNYQYPATTYSYPSYTYTQPYYGQPAIVAPSGSYYYYGPSASASRFDQDGDGVSNSMDRYPYDPRRW